MTEELKPSKFKEIVKSVMEQVDLKENPRTTLKAALIGQNPDVESFAILTSENPMGQKANRKDNKEYLKALKNQLKDGGHPYHPIRGKFDNDEHSFFIYNLSQKAAESYARVYGQQSFIFAIKGEDQGIPYMSYEYWETKDEGKTYKKTSSAVKVKNVQDAQNYFSRLNSYKFKIDFPEEDFDMIESVKAILRRVYKPEDKQWIKEYVNGKRVGMSTYYHRLSLYRTKRKGE